MPIATRSGDRGDADSEESHHHFFTEKGKSEKNFFSFPPHKHAHRDLARPRVYSDLEAIFLMISRGTEDRTEEYQHAIGVKSETACTHSTQSQAFSQYEALPPSSLGLTKPGRE